MKPYVICHMISSVDGSVAVGHWTEGPGNSKTERSAAYAKVHAALCGDAWLVSRVTMAEMTRAAPHPSSDGDRAERPYRFANRNSKAYAIALDSSGRPHFEKPEVDGDHVVVLLGGDVTDSHLREMAADGVSYIVADGAEIDLLATLEVLGRELGIQRLLLEGGGGINGSLLAAGLVDEISLIMAPAVDGRTASRSIFEAGEHGLAGRVELDLTACERLDSGMIHLRYRVRALRGG